MLGSAEGANLPKDFQNKPSEGLRCVELFSGLETEKEAGAMFSRRFEAAGGLSERYGIRIDAKMDFILE